MNFPLFFPLRINTSYLELKLPLSSRTASCFFSSSGIRHSSLVRGDNEIPAPLATTKNTDSTSKPTRVS